MHTKLPHRVIIGLPRWHASARVSVAERLARGLAQRGHDATILLTEPGRGDDFETASEPAAPMDLTVERLPAGPEDVLGQRWEALERYLEERAPCHYLAISDSAVDLIAPRLSNRVRLIGVVDAHESTNGTIIERLAPFWHAILALEEHNHFRLVSRLPHLASRIATICQPTNDSDMAGHDAMITEFISLLERVEHLSERQGFVCRRGGIAASSAHVADLNYMTQTTAWPDPPEASPTTRHAARVPSRRLEDHKVIIASIPGNISGVDVFAAHLVRGLRERGIDARLHGRRLPDGDDAARLPADVPFDERDPPIDADYLGWLNRWRRMVEYLERLSPCIYVPNYDSFFSCVAPQLSERVRVVGIGHSDDPWHYEHLSRIGHACDAIVGVSQAITDHLRALAPGFAPRLETIPYGIPLPQPAANSGIGGASCRGAPLRIIYTGRLVEPQKRAFDLVAIARALDARGVRYEMVIVGDGELRGRMEREAHDLVRARRLWFTGTQPNAGVMELLATADAFLLPSAFEGLSVGMLEAMSRGVVPVVSDIRSGVPEVIVPNENGLVAPVGDIERFADHVERLWRNPEERARMATAAAATVAANYGIDTMIDRYVALFRRIAAEPFARPAGPFVPPAHLQAELAWSTWASRIAADPAASVRRVTKRLAQAWR